MGVWLFDKARVLTIRLCIDEACRFDRSFGRHMRPFRGVATYMLIFSGFDLATMGVKAGRRGRIGSGTV